MATDQPHTFTGERGNTILNRGAADLQYRDIYEAVLIGYNRARGAADDADPYGPDPYDGVIDPKAMAQNVCVRLEELEGIFPNIEKDG